MKEDDFIEEEKYHEFDENDMKVSDNEKLNIIKCDSKKSSKVLKTILKTEVNPDLDTMSKSNSSIMNAIDDIIIRIVEKDQSFSNIDNETLDKLADILIVHSVIEDSIDKIIKKSEEL